MTHVYYEHLCVVYQIFSALVSQMWQGQSVIVVIFSAERLTEWSSVGISSIIIFSWQYFRAIGISK